MVNPLNGLEEAWQLLSASAPRADHMPSRPISTSTPCGPVRVALDADGVRHLLIPVRRRGDVVVDKRSRGVVVVAQELEGDQGPQWFADLVCVEQQILDVYTRIADAVCDAIETDPDIAGSVPARLLDAWRELLSAPTKTMGREARIGLFGELVVLLKAIDEAGPSVFTQWLGTAGHHHDFAGDGAAMEVKTTTAKNGRRVEVHGLEQLARGPNTELYVAFVRLLVAPEGKTIADLVSGITARGVPQLDLLAHLRKVGYDPQHEDDETRYHVREFDLYEVDEKFPAMTPDSFPSGVPIGVESVRYIIDLAAAGDPLGDQAIEAVFRQFAQI